jgi:glutamate dehydrogenase/leucine dehydrogenase
MEIEKINKISQLREGVSKVIEDEDYSPDPNQKFVVADMITGYGVAESAKHYYKIYSSKSIKGKTAIIQGWGNVASAAAYYLAKDGVKIIGIIDRQGGLINEQGFSFEEIRDLFLNKKGNQLIDDNMIPYAEVNKKIWDLKTDIFIPGAASRLLQREHIDRLVAAGLEVISSGANVPFADKEIFFGPICEYADKEVSVIPDFIANCGMARVFAYLMNSDVDLADDAIFLDTSNAIEESIKRSYNKSSKITGIYQTSLELALNQLV